MTSSNENLYRLAGRYMIGDFGLIDLPKVEPLTVGSRAVGPRFYIAPEMVTDPCRDDCRPADVYSLAKTLWVLMTGQNYPPPGTHRLEEPTLTVSAYIEAPRTATLDLLVERCTAHEPEMRPTIAQVHEELVAWMEFARPDAAPLDISTTARAIANRLEPRQRAKEQKERKEKQLEDLRSALWQRGVCPLIEAAVEAGLRPQMTGQLLAVVEYLSRYQLHRADAVGMNGSGAMFGVDSGRRSYIGRPSKFFLWSGVGYVELADGEAAVVAGHLLGPTAESLSPHWTKHVIVLPGSAVADNAVGALAADLVRTFPQALKELEDALIEFGL